MTRMYGLPSWRIIQRHLAAHPVATTLAVPRQAACHAASRSIHQSRHLLSESDDGHALNGDGVEVGPRLPKTGQDSPGSQPAQDLLKSLQDEFPTYKQNFNFSANTGATAFHPGKLVTVNGFLTGRRVQSSKLVFADIETYRGSKIQVMAQCQGGDENLQSDLMVQELIAQLRKVPLHSAVSVTGLAEEVESKEDSQMRLHIKKAMIKLQKIQLLNPFPKDVIMSRDMETEGRGLQFPGHQRHMQIRTTATLRNRLKFRASVANSLRKSLLQADVTEYETPLLFRSTSEGAREFLVPTRRRGHAFALPQSPQQFKQLLMASGIPAYFQFARCFRDEDLRADRQPEFTQLDLELAFATGEDVMRLVEGLIEDVAVSLRPEWGLHDDVPVPVLDLGEKDRHYKFRKDDFKAPFPRMTYQKAMESYGTDKPDLRVPWKIQKVDDALPDQFVKMITNLKNPCVEAFVFSARDSLQNTLRAESRLAFGKALSQFMEVTLPRELQTNPAGKPAMLRYDSGQPLNGLSALGHEGAEKIPSLLNVQLEDGDVIFFQAREDGRFHGQGSTALGQLSTALYAEAVKQKWVPTPQSGDFRWLWVTDFPLFTPAAVDDDEAGQGGRTGLRSTHHPFTAPKGPDDLEELLFGDPLSVYADHYDLVVNGVELGGGSRRIHVAALQEHVLRGVLGMAPERVAEFDHLLKALRTGCPPHAGFALGFDRLVALLSQTDKVRDVIAFPKTTHGKDLMTKSPGVVQPEDWWPYHLMPTHVPRRGGGMPYKDLTRRALKMARWETRGGFRAERDPKGYGSRQPWPESRS